MDPLGSCSLEHMQSSMGPVCAWHWLVYRRANVWHQRVVNLSSQKITCKFWYFYVFFHVHSHVLLQVISFPDIFILQLFNEPFSSKCFHSETKQTMVQFDLDRDHLFSLDQILVLWSGLWYEEPFTPEILVQTKRKTNKEDLKADDISHLAWECFGTKFWPKNYSLNIFREINVSFVKSEKTEGVNPETTTCRTAVHMWKHSVCWNLTSLSHIHTSISDGISIMQQLLSTHSTELMCQTRVEKMFLNWRTILKAEHFT